VSPREQKGVSDAELDVLKTLWDGGPGTPRDVLQRLKGRGRSWAYTTVQTLLMRLHEKRFVTSDKSARAHVFTAAVTRDDLLARELGDLAARVCGGEATPLMMNLVKGRRFSAEQIRGFREMLDRLATEAESAPYPDRRQGRAPKKR
jgi:predicted transcriptional regulator